MIGGAGGGRDAQETAVPSANVYTLKIALLKSKPAIWRTVEVRGDTTLAGLHRIIQARGIAHPHAMRTRRERRPISMSKLRSIVTSREFAGARVYRWPLVVKGFH